MDKIKLHYIANYAGDRDDLVVSPAGNNKMQYMISALKATNHSLTVYSTAEIKKGISFGKKLKIGENAKLIYGFSFSFKPYLVQRMAKFFNKLGLYLYLKKLGRNDIVVIYHNTPYMPVINRLKNRKFKLVYEIEEIYSVVSPEKNNEIAIEKNYLKCADAYIFPTQMLDESINQENKPSITVHGSYTTETLREQEGFNDGRIHCLYAGTFNPEKGGAVIAAKAGAFLSEQYHIHILGFGAKADQEYLLSEIQSVSASSNCKVTFDGLLSGEEYIRFVQKCHIGLSTQNPNATFNTTSFPSKVLSYLANGLRVVSARIEAVERSAVGNLIYYYDENDSQMIAKAICKVDLAAPYDSRRRIEELNFEFVDDLATLINKMIAN